MALNYQNVKRKQPFLFYPINKSLNGYSYFNSSPIITFEFNPDVMKVIPSSSLRICGTMKIFNTQSGKNQLPANVFDINGNASSTINSNEQVAYIDDRTAVGSIFSSVSIANIQGNMLEQDKNYNRKLSSLLSASTSYKSLCSSSNMNFGACANNDVIARECCSEMEFACPVSAGFIMSNPYLSLEKGFQLRFNLASDSMVIYGLSARDYVYKLENVCLMGDYLHLEKPVANLINNYSAYYNYMVVANSGNDHANLNLNLNMVNKIFHNFIPSSWNNNFSYNSFSTCPLLNADGSDKGFSEAKIKQYVNNRGAVRYPANYEVNERRANTDGVFQAFRSRKYLGSIFPYYKMNNCLISPDSEELTSVVKARSNWLKTPQNTDQALVRAWKKNADGSFSRGDNGGAIEKSSHVYGIGLILDGMAIRQSSNYANASYNYNIESELDSTPNNVFAYCLATTLLNKDKQGNVIAVN